MKVIVVSSEDPASVNIMEELMAKADWKENGDYDGNTVLDHGDFRLVQINEIHLYYEDIDRHLKEQMDITPDYIVVASRHRSQSGLRTLTVHPLGNFNTADFGGRNRMLAPSAPREMTHALITLAKKAAGLDFKITYEATHHGPYNALPMFFIEIGSDETAWPEKEPARAIADTILSLDGELATSEDTVAVGIGGGHYMPRISEVALGHKMSFGHMVPAYAVENLDPDMIGQIMEKTPGAEGLYFHRKGLSKPKHRELRELCESLGHEVFSTKEIEER